MPRALFPEVAEERFGGGAAVGWLYAAIAIGSVLGGLTSGWIGRVRRQGLALVLRGGRLGRSLVGAGRAGAQRCGWWCCCSRVGRRGRPGQRGLPAVDPADLRAGRDARPAAGRVHGGGRRRPAPGRPAGRCDGRGLGRRRSPGSAAASPPPCSRSCSRWRSPRCSGTGPPATDPARRRTRYRRPHEHASLRPTPAVRDTVDHRGRRPRGRRGRGRRWAAGLPGRRGRRLDGYAEDEICPGCAGQILAPWPNRIRDGRYTFGGESLPAGADRAGPAQRDPRAGQLGRAGAWSSGPPDAVTRRVRPAAAARATRGRCGCAPGGRSAPTGCGPTTRRPTSAATAVPVRASPSTRTCSCPASPSTTCSLQVPAPQPAAGRRPAAADRRGPGGRQRVRLHRAAPRSARPCSTPRSAT